MSVLPGPFSKYCVSNVCLVLYTDPHFVRGKGLPGGHAGTPGCEIWIYPTHEHVQIVAVAPND